MKPPDASHFDPASLDGLPLTRLHLLAVLLSALGFAFDLFEVGLGSALSAIFSAPPNAATTHELSWLLAAVYVGAIVGTPLLGRLGDRLGRRVALTRLLTLLAVASGLCAASRGLGQLTAARALAGIGIGAYPPLMIAYLTDVMPASRRGMLVFVASGLAALGPPAGIFLIRWLTPIAPAGLEAWRWAFIAGSAGAAVSAVLFRLLPESPRWLAAVDRHSEAQAALVRFRRSKPVVAAPRRVVSTPPPRPGGAGRIRSPKPGGATAAMLCLLYFLSPWSTVAFPLLSSAILLTKGFKLSDALLYVGLSTFGPVIGTLVAAAVVDRVDRRSALLGCAATMAAGCIVFVLSDSPGWLVASSLVFLLGACVYLPTLTTYGAEHFPTTRRASGSAMAWTLNRIGAAIAPLALFPLLRAAGAPGIGAAIAGALLAGALLLLVLPKGLARRSVS